ncbi:MAG: hypothetical protein GY861_19075 [bacterium]|nr:hypothetical protein [bacterium]
MANENLKFEADLLKFAIALNISSKVIIKKITLDIFRDIIKMSPVDKGSFRASHQIGIDTPSEDVVIMGGESKSNKRAARAKALEQTKKLSQADAADTIWISNNLPYAEKLEYGGYNDGPKTTGGFSKQAPQGVYRKALQAAEATIQAQLDKIDFDLG